MGLHFRKSIKIAKGVRLNLSQKSASVTVGPRGLHYTISTTGRQTATASLPGTGLYYTKTVKGASKKNGSSAKTSKPTAPQSSSGKNIRSSSQMRQEREAQAAALAQAQAQQAEKEAMLQEAAAEVEGYEAYVQAITHVHLECREPAVWEEKPDADRCLEIIEQSDLFDELAEYGCNFEIGTEDGETVEVEFQAMIPEIVPAAALNLTKTGTIKETALTKTAYYALAQDYICSSCLRIAREVFALLPVSQVKVHVTDTAISTATGQEEEFTILSVAFDRSRMEQIRFEYIDASDCVGSFPNNMHFGKTTGFKPVERL